MREDSILSFDHVANHRLSTIFDSGTPSLDNTKLVMNTMHLTYTCTCRPIRMYMYNVYQYCYITMCTSAKIIKGCGFPFFFLRLDICRFPHPLWPVEILLSNIQCGYTCRMHKNVLTFFYFLFSVLLFLYHLQTYWPEASVEIVNRRERLIIGEASDSQRRDKPTTAADVTWPVRPSETTQEPRPRFSSNEYVPLIDN